MAFINRVGGSENLNKEIAEQTNLLDNILESLSNKVSYTELGKYAWYKYTEQGGDFIEFVVSNNSNEYPKDGTKDSYYYISVS